MPNAKLAQQFVTSKSFCMNEDSPKFHELLSLEREYTLLERNIAEVSKALVMMKDSCSSWTEILLDLAWDVANCEPKFLKSNQVTLDDAKLKYDRAYREKNDCERWLRRAKKALQQFVTAKRDYENTESLEWKQRVKDITRTLRMSRRVPDCDSREIVKENQDELFWLIEHRKG